MPTVLDVAEKKKNIFHKVKRLSVNFDQEVQKWKYYVRSRNGIFVLTSKGYISAEAAGKGLKYIAEAFEDNSTYQEYSKCNKTSEEREL